MSFRGKCETYSERCINWDKAKTDGIPSGKYPKSRRVGSTLFAVYQPNGSFFLMCAACKWYIETNGLLGVAKRVVR